MGALQHESRQRLQCRFLSRQISPGFCTRNRSPRTKSKKIVLIEAIQNRSSQFYLLADSQTGPDESGQRRARGRKSTECERETAGQLIGRKSLSTRADDDICISDHMLQCRFCCKALASQKDKGTCEMCKCMVSGELEPDDMVLRSRKNEWVPDSSEFALNLKLSTKTILSRCSKTQPLQIEIPSPELIQRNPNLRLLPPPSPPQEPIAEVHVQRANSASSFRCFRVVPLGSVPVLPGAEYLLPSLIPPTDPPPSRPLLNPDPTSTTESSSPGEENMPILVETDVCSMQCRRLQLPQLTPPHFVYHYLSHSEPQRRRLPRKRPRTPEEPLDLSKKSKA